MSLTSLWQTTAPSAPDFPALEESAKTDVLVIGGGFQGLSAALHLAEAGADVLLVEAGMPGQGASGQNGGQVIPGLKDDPDMLDRLWGAQATAFAGGTADTLFSLVERLGIDCDAERTGWIQAGNKNVHLPALRFRMEQWARRGAPVDWLNDKAMARATGSGAFRGGWIDQRAGKIHPLKLAYGLSLAAQRAGARIHAQSPVAALTRDREGWLARLASGPSVRAERVIMATNVYTPAALNAELRRATVPANSFQIATQPLNDAQRASILPGGEAVSEIRRVGTYFRIGPEGRLMLGGRGRFADPTRPAHFRMIERELAKLFGPGLAIEHRWCGRVGMTPDHRIRVCAPAPGMLLSTGFNGRGVALSVALGKAFAEHLTKGTALPIPVETRIRTLPFHGLHPLYASIAIRYYRLRDQLDR
ncbi:MAG: FAD-dependent oxidoreductase [Thalassovita sp.]|nr:FAD-dependent oxidoreductase [Thalassovita sp.]